MTPREISIDLPHIRLAGQRWGDGEHIVLALHGWLDNAASLAVISEPDSNAASTTSVTCDNAAIRRLRRGKLPANGRVSKGNSLTINPFSAIS